MGETLDPGAGRPVPSAPRVRVFPVAPDTGSEMLPPGATLPERFGEAAGDAGFKPEPHPTPPLGGAFARAHVFVAAHEGGFQANPADPGNWTGGKCGVGVLRGTNWGISAAAYPDVDIRALSRQQAAALYRRDYWNRVRGDDLPPPLALLVYDFAVNSGVNRAARTLQQVLGVAQDGAIGPVTLAAVRSRSGKGADLCAEYLAARLLFLTGLPTWRTFGKGWGKRLCTLPFQAMTMGDGP